MISRRCENNCNNKARLAFDAWQFFKPGKPYDALSAMSYAETQRVGVVLNSTRDPRWIPAWAASDEQVRRVLLLKAWRTLQTHCPLPSGIPPRMIDRLATECSINHAQASGDEAHVNAVRKAGSYLALMAALVYRAYRLGMDSTSIAQETGMNPPAVRVALKSLNDCARKLGLETFSRHWTAGQHFGPRPRKEKANAQQAA